MFYSPLRYPGGKGKLEPFMEFMIKKLGHLGGTYIEPFAGGAGIALELLDKGIVNEIVINDYDKGIYSFWKAILTETDRFIQDIRYTPLTMAEWNRQRNITINMNNRYSYELGFATFYMNRTNRSGIIKGGVIGGVAQSGKWKMDARFNREELIKRIERIVSKKTQIHLYNKDIESFIAHYIPRYQNNSLTYFDPPYYNKGEELYLNFFRDNDHKRIEKIIQTKLQSDWIITYDDSPHIAKIYSGYEIKRFDLNYSAGKKRKASEIIVFKNIKMVPTDMELQKEKICINLRWVRRKITDGRKQIFKAL